MAKDPAGTQFQTPAYGTPTLPRDPETALRSGNFTRVPVMIGHTRDEARFVTAGIADLKYPKGMSENDYKSLLDAVYGVMAPQVLRRYPPSAYTAESPKWAPALAWAAAETDRTAACPTLRDAATLARQVTVHAYEFTDPNAPSWGPEYTPKGFPQGTQHISDLFSLFQVTRPDLIPAQLTPAEQQLSLAMISYWTRFARNGDPGSPHWARYSHVQNLATTGIRPVNDAAEHQCGFWNSPR
jgi:para-nitrobenzyl esterase